MPSRDGKTGRSSGSGLKIDSTVPACCFCLFKTMGFFELSLYITMAVYGIIICFRYLLPFYIIENLSTLLNDVEHCLTSAATIAAIPEEYREDLEMYAVSSLSLQKSSHELAQPRGRPCTDAY